MGKSTEIGSMSVPATGGGRDCSWAQRLFRGRGGEGAGPRRGSLGGVLGRPSS